jgi:hypothetical protein
MRRKTRVAEWLDRKCVVLLSVSFFLAFILAGVPVWAQPQTIQFKNLDAPPAKIQPTRIIKHPPIAAQIKPGTIKINKLQPIQFKPFTIAELRHPKTHPTKAGLPIAPDEQITVTQKENGKIVATRKITGRQLLDEINKLEQKYNALGYSIRRPVTTPIVIKESIVKRDLLQRQLQNSKLKYRPLVPVKAPKFANMQANYTQRLNQMPSIVQNLNKIQPSLSETIPQPINQEKNYDDYWGDRDFFAAGLHGKIKFYADKDKIQASAEGKATAVVFNHEWTILSINGGSEAPTTKSDGQMHAYLKVTALGDDLFAPIDRRGKAPLPIVEDDQNISVDESVKIPVVELGPFSINVTLGFHGQAGIRYGIYLNPGNLQARFMPYLETSAYGQVGLNVWVLVSIEAGIGARLTLFNDYLTLSAIAGIGFDQPQPYFFYEYYAKNTIDALSGEIYAYVTVDYYIDSTTWKWNIFSWNGFHHDGYVIGPVTYNVPIRPKEEPDAWQVTVYEHANYGGKSRVYTIYPGKCQAMQLNLIDVGMNDMISSVKVGKNVAVYLFEHVPYSGKYIRLDESTSWIGKDFNDMVSSLIVFPKSMGQPVGVWLIGNKKTFRYVQDPEHHDSCSCKTGVTNHPRVPYNDDATKVIIPRIDPQSPAWGYIEVELFEHENYKGRSVKFKAGPSGGEFALPPELNRKVSSLKIFLNVSDPKRLQRPW